MAIGTAGFIQLRRGLDEHVRDGRLSFFEGALYVYILLNTNPSTGICYGSAGLFAAIYSLSERTCRDALEKLEDKGYLKRFPTRGKHGSYPILINKFLCSSGAMKGMYVNTEKSVSCISVSYEKCDDYVNEGGNERVNDGVHESAASKILDTREEKEIPMSLFDMEAEPPAVSRREEVIDKAWNYYKEKFGRNGNYDFSTTRKSHGDKAWKALQRKCKELSIPEADRAESILTWLCDAIDNLKSDKFHNGQNDRNMKYNDWENLFVGQKWRSPDKLTDFWLNGYKFPNRAGVR